MKYLIYSILHKNIIYNAFDCRLIMFIDDELTRSKRKDQCRFSVTLTS